MTVRSLLLLSALALWSCRGVEPLAVPSTGAVRIDYANAGRGQLYLPLAVNNSWKYTCRDIKGGGENNGNPFTIYHSVLGTVTVNGQQYFKFSLQVPQVPSRPLKIDTEIMLLHNDPQGNLWIRGYMIHGAVHQIHAAKILSSATPPKFAKFGYTGPNGKPVSRIFYGIEPTNRTPLGVFTVADYEESNATHDYGYARGTGIAEEDHGPNFEVDCLIEHVVLH